jgi:transposase-like protein
MWCVRWYLRYPISVAQMAEMTRERGLASSPSCVWRWVQTYGPELDKRCRRHRKPTNRSGRVAETYIKVKGRSDSGTARSIPADRPSLSCLTAKRDTAAAKRFFRRGMAHPGNALPRVINVDQNRAYPAAVAELTSCSASPRKKPFNSASSRPSLPFATESVCEKRQPKCVQRNLMFFAPPCDRPRATGPPASDRTRRRARAHIPSSPAAVWRPRVNLGEGRPSPFSKRGGAGSGCYTAA